MNEAQTFIRIEDGLDLPIVGFGTCLISQNDSAPAVTAAIVAGYRHIDTAVAYENEAGVGAGIRAGISAIGIARRDIFVTAKLWPGNADWDDAPKGYEAVLEAFETTRSALGLDYIDLYLVHAPTGGAERLNQWRAMLHLKDEGKVRAIGVSNFAQSHIEEIKTAGLPLPAVNQIELHPWSQKPALVPYLNQNGIKPIAYSSLVPLSTWRAKEGEPSSKTEAMKAASSNGSSPFKTMALKYGVSEAQLLLRWGVQKGFAILPKSLSPNRMRENLDLFGFVIDQNDMALIEGMDRGDGVAWPIGDPTKLG
ncbi:aldo/keto reductase [Neorhizobium sp. S3-V5DH]|uniref:aldo/keto reductase family protein n=1 Tax=Neorhizobium sp. S3-V5DH TaxID=2485166 RepID=UPI0010533DDB|nr:aldo/keto reductase [Neorhizobium sp. S3-V5DH]TCV67420.1 2,5-diketo-D-gluconate reductase A [Neorhizobium sp. S3-V5DH]